MSSTTTFATLSSTSASTSTCTSPMMYELPIKDAACGIPNDADYKTTFESCACPATVQAYHSGCALYAPALNQSVQDLIDVFMTPYKIATATPTSTSNPTSTSAFTKEAAEEETGSENDDPNRAVAARALGPRIVALGLLGLLLAGFWEPV
ncbi:hypothetical protein BDW71DRAFT_203675 [Aspergillus fruticulosus]